MKPAWDKLMDQFNTDKILIGDCYCTTDKGRPLCKEQGLQGYPYIVYGPPGKLRRYTWKRDYDSLYAFYKHRIDPECEIRHPEMCEEPLKSNLEKLHALSYEELVNKVEERKGQITKLESDLKAWTANMNLQYKDATKKNTDASTAFKKNGLSIMKAVQAYKKKAKAEL